MEGLHHIRREQEVPKATKQTPRKKKKTTKKKPQRQESSSAWPDQDGGLKLNVYGKSGTGKTTFWATFPDPILALVCSGSNKPGELRSIDTEENRKRIHPVMVNSVETIREFIASASEHEQWSTIILDHASGLQDLVLAEILGLDQAPVSLYRAAGKGESWSVVSRQQYGQVATEMKELLRALLSLACNVVIVAQERDFNTEVEGDLINPYVASALTPSVVGWLNPACDYIVQTFLRPEVVEKTKTVQRKEVTTKRRTGKIEYCLRCAPHEVYTCKFRSPMGSNDLPEAIVDPTYAKVLELIQGAKL
jgi:hypothetical protein